MFLKHFLFYHLNLYAFKNEEENNKNKFQIFLGSI